MIAVLSGGAFALAGRHVEDVHPAFAEHAAPCVPEHLNGSHVLAGTTLSVSPMPDSNDAMPQTQISMLGVPAREISNVTATGSETGAHPGRLIAYSQGDGASFVPSRPFASGEIVTVEGTIAGAGKSKRFSFHFGVAYRDPMEGPASNPPLPPQGEPGAVLQFHSEPKLQPPAVTVTQSSPAAARGDIFMAPYKGPGQEGPMIVTGSGELVWMDPLPPPTKATNLQVERYHGKPVLTWWQGYIPPQGFGMGEEIVANTSYEPIMHIKAGNGDEADLHDFHLEGNDTAVMTVFETIHCDLSAVGGSRDAAVTDASYQEIDLKTGLVRRQWDSVNHVSMALSNSNPAKASVQWPFDFFHINTVDPRGNGTTLISSRNTSALYVIDTKSGVVQTRIGGRESEVQMGQGAHTAFQHDAMTLPDGDISIFDNGGAPFSTETTKYGHQYGEVESRGVIVEVNAERKTDNLLLELKHSPPVQAGSQGDVQPMENGNWFVGWGQEPYLSEYDSAGEQIYDAHLPEEPASKAYKGDESYRTYRFEWHATPHWPPSIAAERAGAGAGGMQVWASWNGATEVASWRVLGGSSPSKLAPIASVAKTGFETAIKSRYTPYVEVQALGQAGAVIGNSPTIKPKG